MCGCKQENHENRVHAKIQVIIPVKTPTQPHQGKEDLFKESLYPDLVPLKPLTINGKTSARIKKVYAVKAIHENGLWLIYIVFGGNSKYLSRGYPASTIPKRGSPSSIPPRIKNFNKILFIPVITVDFAVKFFVKNESDVL